MIDASLFIGNNEKIMLIILKLLENMQIVYK